MIVCTCWAIGTEKFSLSSNYGTAFDGPRRNRGHVLMFSDVMVSTWSMMT